MPCTIDARKKMKCEMQSKRETLCYEGKVKMKVSVSTKAPKILCMHEMYLLHLGLIFK